MIKEIVKDTFLLSRRCEAATLDDLQTVQDLQDTLQAHADHCVGMAANVSSYFRMAEAMYQC